MRYQVFDILGDDIVRRYQVSVSAGIIPRVRFAYRLHALSVREAAAKALATAQATGFTRVVLERIEEEES